MCVLVYGEKKLNVIIKRFKTIKKGYADDTVAIYSIMINLFMI